MFDCLFENKNANENKEKYVFKLPIDYLDESVVFDLSPTVAADLEMRGGGGGGDDSSDGSSAGTIYDIMLNVVPNTFGSITAPLWCRKYTTDTVFLKDTQKILPLVDSVTTDDGELDAELEVHRRLTENKNFLGQYNYIEWDCFKDLNRNPKFLHSLAMLHVFSPAVSLLLPVLFLFLPFVILQVSGIPLTPENYINTLKTVSRNHFIGKLLTVFDNQSFSNLAYVAAMGAFFTLQIYQNTVSFQHYYSNIKQLNDDLCTIYARIIRTIAHIKHFLRAAAGLASYTAFCAVAQHKLHTLQKIEDMLRGLRPFAANVDKLNELGDLLHKYYELYDNTEYRSVLEYAYSFCGFVSNLAGVASLFHRRAIRAASFVGGSDDGGCAATQITKQYYPPHIRSSRRIRNNCRLNKNIIITGVNASGKTTQLKTTMINVILSQQFGCGFYKKCRLVPYTHIHSYLNIPDTSGRDSLFQAESRRCKEIIDIIGETDVATTRHLCIFDELYSGTNADEAKKAAFAFLKYISSFSNVNFILTTHYTELCHEFISDTRIQNYKMLVTRNDEHGELNYLYKMRRGICKMKGGIDILKQMNYPAEILSML